MAPSTPIVLSMSGWASPRRERAARFALAWLYLCMCLIVALAALAVVSEGGTGLSWVSTVIAAVVAVVVASLAVLAAALRRQLRELRAGRQSGEVAVFPDHVRIRFPGVLTHDLVLAASQVRAVCVDDRRPVWAAMCWYRFPVASRGPGSRYPGCLYRSHLPNTLQLLGPSPAVPNVAVLFDRPLRLEQATGLGQEGESLALLAAQLDDVETANDLPGARPLDPGRPHPGLFLEVDSASAARQAFATWPAGRAELQESDVRLLRTTPMPGTARRIAGAVAVAWLLAAVAVTATAVVTRSWGWVVPVALVPAAVGGLVYETVHSLRALQRPRAAAATLAAVGVLAASVLLDVFEIRDLTTFDDPPPGRPPSSPPSYYVPEDPFPSQPTGVPLPSPETWDPLRPQQ